MLRQAQWSIHEAVILLDELLRYKDNNSSRTEAILSVSKQLRRMAENRGQMIDDVYRNTNGISFQMSSMESALAGRTIMKAATRLFTEAVAIYRNDPAKFERLLKEAKVMISGKQMTNEEKFMTWLASKVSPAQLSELYGTYREIEAFCLRIKVLKAPLFETLDYSTARKVQQTIESNKAFRIFRKKNVNICIAAASHYCKYLKELQKTQHDIITAEQSCSNPESISDTLSQPTAASLPVATPPELEEDESRSSENDNVKQEITLPEQIKSALKEECESNSYGTTVTYLQGKLAGASASEIKKILEESPWAIFTFGTWKYQEVESRSDNSVKTNAEDKIPIVSPAKESEVLTVDFENTPSLVYTKPVSFSYFEETTDGLRSWTDLYVKFFSVLYEDYPHLLHIGASFTANGDGRVELGNASMSHAMAAPKVIATPNSDELYLETNLSANNIVGKIKFLLNLCSVDHDNVVIKYRPKLGDTPTNSTFYSLMISSSEYNASPAIPFADKAEVYRVAELLTNNQRYREAVIFLLSVEFGLTADTITSLRVADFVTAGKIRNTVTFDIPRQAANSRGIKGTYTLSDVLKESIRLYLDQQRHSSETDFLIKGESNRSNLSLQVNPRSIYRIMKAVSEEFGITPELLGRNLYATYSSIFAQSESEIEDDDFAMHADPVKSIVEIKRLIEIPLSNDNYRDYLLLVLGFSFGLTGKQLRSIRFSDLMNKDGSIRSEFPVLGEKDNFQYAENFVSVSDTVRSAFELFRKHNAVTDTHAFIFQSMSNNASKHALSAISISRIVQAVVAEAGLYSQASTLIFKKTFVYHQLLLSGNSLEMNYRLRSALHLHNAAQLMSYLNSTEDEFAAKAKIATTARDVSSNTYDSLVDGFTSWMLAGGAAPATTRSYSGAIRSAEEYAKKHSFSHQVLLTEKHDLAVMTTNELFADEGFIEYNRRQHNRFRAAITKLLEYYGVNYSFKRQKFASAESTEEVATPEAAIETIPFRTVLASRFVRGFRIGSPLDMKKFRRYYESETGQELSLTNEETEQAIRASGIEYNDMVYVPDVMLSPEIREKLFGTIRESFAEGKNAVYYEALFRSFSESFLDYYIYDADMLKAYIAFYNKGEFHMGNRYISKDAVIEVNPAEEVKKYLVTAGRPIESEEICETLSHLPQKKVMQILGMNSEFINNGKSNYFHVSILHLTEEDLDHISTLIADAINDKTFVSGNELLEMIQARYPHILESNLLISMMGMRDALKYHLGSKFSFKGNIISDPARAISMADVFGNYARMHTTFTMTELKNLAVEMNATVYFDAVYDNSLRISKEQFVSKEYAQFRVEDTDRVIARFCTGSFIPIGMIREFGTFPDAGYPWTTFLLEHYVYSYSRQFKLLHAGFNRECSVGAIVRKEAEIDQFMDLLSIALGESTTPIKKDNALSFFVEQGYLARRNYSDIEQVLIQAKTYRNRKGTK